MMLCVEGKVNYDLPLGPSNSSKGPDIHGRWTIYLFATTEKYKVWLDRWTMVRLKKTI